MAAAQAASSFSLDDAVTSNAELFFESGNNLPKGDTPEYVSPVRTGVIEQFEIDDGGVSQSRNDSFLSRSTNFFNVKQYQSLFAVSVDDVCGRIFRSCVPYRGLLDPPPAHDIHAPEIQCPSDSDDSEETVEASLAANTISSRQSGANTTSSVEYVKPFNSDPDLYTPIWVSTTLILSIAVCASLSTVLRSVAARQDVFHGATLRAIDVSNLVRASAIIYSYLIMMCVGVVLGKRYVNDSCNAAPVFVLCVYGYSLAPLVPAVFLCTLLSAGLSWAVFIVAASISTCTVATNLWPDMVHILHAPPSEEGIESDQGVLPTYSPPLVSCGPVRSPTWWLRVGVIVTHMLLGLFLKLRFL